MESHFERMRGDGSADDAWFAEIADLLLLETDLLIAGAAHRLKEIEFYYNGPGHEDPFAHGEDVQKTFGRWYFHREGGGYRGGSFKGLDISFGPEGVVGGVLIRTLETPEGDLVNGCSLCVDHMLARTERSDVASLDAGLGSVWEEGALQLVPAAPRGEDVYATARVGLTLKRLSQHPTMPAYLMRRYRFLTEPRIKKGKLHTVIAMHQDGLTAEEIAGRTGSRKHTIERYAEHHEAGRDGEGFGAWAGAKLSSEDLCRIHGRWVAAFAAS